MAIRVVMRQYATIPFIFGACLFILEYTISSITMMNYYHDGDSGRIKNGNGGLRGGEWEIRTSSTSEDVNTRENEDTTTYDIDAHPWPWARENLLPIITSTTTALYQEQSPQTTTKNNTTFLFWHIAKSGGTTAKAVYKCLLGKSVSILSSRAHVIKARERKEKKSLKSFMGFVSSQSSFTSSLTSSSAKRRSSRNSTPDIIFSMLPDMVAMNLFNPTNKGRLLALFRHPVDRLISKFYYLQIADWEKGYKPHWKNKSLLTWAASINNDNEHMVRTLAGKHTGDLVTELDLRRAKETIRQYAVVGLTIEMEESIRRFNIIMGINTDKVNDDGARARCINEFFGGQVNMSGMKKLNSNPHPVVTKGDLEWDILAERNKLDIQLYDFIVRLFDEQTDIINSYHNINTNTNPPSILWDWDA